MQLLHLPPWATEASLSELFISVSFQSKHKFCFAKKKKTFQQSFQISRQINSNSSLKGTRRKKWLKPKWKKKFFWMFSDIPLSLSTFKSFWVLNNLIMDQLWQTGSRLSSAFNVFLSSFGWMILTLKLLSNRADLFEGSDYLWTRSQTLGCCLLDFSAQGYW